MSLNLIDLCQIHNMLQVELTENIFLLLVEGKNQALYLSPVAKVESKIFV